VPFEHVVAAIAPDRETGRTAMFDVAIVNHGEEPRSRDGAGRPAPFTRAPHRNRTARLGREPRAGGGVRTAGRTHHRARVPGRHSADSPVRTLALPGRRGAGPGVVAGRTRTRGRLRSPAPLTGPVGVAERPRRARCRHAFSSRAMIVRSRAA
jgi:hypothetical protein